MLLGLAIVVAAVSGASAHRRDEYLQAARVGIDPDRVELQLDLTPGISLADRVIAEIDRNHDGVVSEGEGRDYAALVERDITLAVDGRVLPLALRDWRGAAPEAMLHGEGTMRLRWQASLPSPTAGPHRLTFRNRHHNDIGVYLANALVPESDRVAVTAQDRDADQRELSVSYELKAPSSAGRTLQLLGLGGTLVTLAFVKSRIRPGRRVAVVRRTDPARGVFPVWRDQTTAASPRQRKISR